MLTNRRDDGGERLGGRGTGRLAEVLAKAVLLRGATRAFDLIDAAHVHALTVDRDGHVRTTAGFDDFTGGNPLLDQLDLGRRPV